MTDTTFPEVVRRKSSTVTIYKTINRGKDRFTIVHYDACGKRCRKMLRDYLVAKRVAVEIADNMAIGNLDVITLSGRDRYVYERAVEMLKSTGLGLDAAAFQLVEAHKALDGTAASVVDAARSFASSNPTKLQVRKTVGEVVNELIKSKEAKGRSAYHTKDLRSRLGRFAAAFRCPISSVLPAEIDQFLTSLNLSPRSKNNFRRAIGMLLKFSKVKAYISQNHPGIEAVERSTEEARDITIFTPVELRALMNAADESLIPCLALAAFAGLRHEELRRANWSDIKLSEGHIEIKAAQAKTRVRRLVPISENLRQWLLPRQRPTGPVAPFANLCAPLLKLAKKAGVKWSRNVLRHSFISYRTAKIQDVQQVALESGNSAKVIFRNYLKVVTPKCSDAWFQIAPRDRVGIITLPASEPADQCGDQAAANGH